MSTELVPPPIYSQDDPDEGIAARNPGSQTTPLGPQIQILIIPATNAINFQKGYLGAEGERAAIEGELQIKGAEEGHWGKVTMSLRTVEQAYEREIELSYSELVLSSSESSINADTTTLPSTFPFSLPLTSDTPQSIRTPDSGLSHKLTATLHPLDPLSPSLSKTIQVHTRRYTSHAYSIPLAPETYSLDDPTRVEVEIPRSTFKAGESIPVYVKVPPPRRELVLEQGLRLRNVRTELVRIVKVKREGDETDSSESEADTPFYGENQQWTHDGPSNAGNPDSLRAASSSKAPIYPHLQGSTFRNTIARSGALCRFHATRPVQLRFVLHQSSPSTSPSDFQVDLPNGECSQLDSDTDCASITQTTVLHTVTFRLNIHISFVDMSSHTERFSTISIPIVILARSAVLPEIEESVSTAYQKKHDRPPARTVRYEEADRPASYVDSEAGPSVIPNGAPPPFEERDAPPPFFTSEAEASTSSRLPSFLESEREIFVPQEEIQSIMQPARPAPSIYGEGTVFGFPASEQFDGHLEEMQQSVTPPPTLEMASRDPDLTELVDIREPNLAMEALNLALEQHEEAHGELPPPPPPAMDDPSDPPPSIDSDFRSPPNHEAQITRPRPPPSPHSIYDHPPSLPVMDYPSDPPPSIDSEYRVPDSSRRSPPPDTSSPGLHARYAQLREPPPDASHTEQASTHTNAPPPYLNPSRDQENVTRPPPYIDLIPSESDTQT